LFIQLATGRYHLQIAGNKVTVCLNCKKTFSNPSNLKKHLKKFHTDEIKEKVYHFSCEICGRHKKNLVYHVKTHNSRFPDSPDVVDKTDKKPSKISNKCPMCNFTVCLKDLLNHFKEVHDIIIQEKKMQFPSNEEFSQWKNDMESKTNSKFTKGKRETFSTHVTEQYYCHRSGNYIPRGNGLRHLKTQGSNKINAYCPASIKVISDNNKI
jgi:hypothetical protein